MELLGTHKAALESIFYGQNIRYKVNFPLLQPVPKLTKLYYNGQLICQGPAEANGYVTTIKLEHTLKTESSDLLGSHGFPTQHNNNQGIGNRPVVHHTTPSGIVAEVEIVVHPNGGVSVGPTPSKKPQLSDFQWILADGSSQHGTERPVTIPVTTQVIPTTSTTVSTTTVEPSKPQKPGSLDDLLDELYGTNSEFLDKSSTTTTTSTQR